MLNSHFITSNSIDEQLKNLTSVLANSNNEINDELDK